MNTTTITQKMKTELINYQHKFTINQQYKYAITKIFIYYINIYILYFENIFHFLKHNKNTKLNINTAGELFLTTTCYYT